MHFVKAGGASLSPQGRAGGGTGIAAHWPILLCQSTEGFWVTLYNKVIFLKNVSALDIMKKL